MSAAREAGRRDKRPLKYRTHQDGSPADPVYVGYFDGSHWERDGDNVYRRTEDGPRWEGSYAAWERGSAGERFLRGDADNA